MKRSSEYLFIIILTVLMTVLPLKSSHAQVGGYIGIWGGYTINPYARTNNNDYVYFYPYDYDLDMKDTGVFGGKLGYTFPLKYFALEFEYFYFNPDINRSVVARYGPDYVAVEGDVKLNNFMFNAIAKYAPGRFHPYFGGGIGVSYSDMTAVATQNIVGEMTYASVGKNYTYFAWQLLAGVEIDVVNNLSIDLNYRYYATGIEFANNSEIYFENNRTIDFTTSMLTAGLKILF